MTTVNYIIPALAFIAISHPETYKLVRGVAGGWVATAEGLPKLGGLVLHSIVFVLLVGWLMTLLNPRKSKYYQPYAFGKAHETHQGDGQAHDVGAPY